jgi:hypothetical protein
MRFVRERESGHAVAWLMPADFCCKNGERHDVARQRLVEIGKESLANDRRLMAAIWRGGSDK